MRSIGPAVTREQSPAFLRNSNGRLDLPGPTQEVVSAKSLVPFLTFLFLFHTISDLSEILLSLLSKYTHNPTSVHHFHDNPWLWSFQFLLGLSFHLLISILACPSRLFSIRKQKGSFKHLHLSSPSFPISLNIKATIPTTFRALHQYHCLA